jgi:endonuclease/exonuclease/phosphatase family metal-dependent hydrolase
MIVASHNLMHGLRLPRLLPHYSGMRDAHGLDLLCVQEDGPLPDGTLRSHAIAAHLGPRYAALSEPGCSGLAVIYDRQRLEPVARQVVPLPRLDRLSWFEKLYIVGGKTKQKYALLGHFALRQGGAPFTAATFHLDTAGDNHHRGRQLSAVAEALAGRGWHTRFTVCGDTNAFAWRDQLGALRLLLAPLAALGGQDPGTRPTHWFGRQNEPVLTHRAAVALGRLGLDVPHRYDVVCTNLPAPRRGQVHTPDSDHDLVWAELDVTAGAAAEASDGWPQVAAAGGVGR